MDNWQLECLRADSWNQRDAQSGFLHIPSSYLVLSPAKHCGAA
jgi:hypothetical protein